MDVPEGAGLAELPEADAIRRQFDERNTAVMVWVMRLTTFVALVQVLGSAWHPWAFLGSLLTLAVFTRLRGLDRPGRPGARWLSFVDPLARPFLTRRRGLALAAYVGAFATLLALSGETPEPWLSMSPWLVVPMLLAATERILLHGAIFLVTLLAVMLGLPGPGNGDMIPISASVNVFALGLGLFLGRRYRKSFLRSWGAARHHFMERSRLQKELDYAREIQLGMLPRESPDLPWLDISGFSLPAMEVGGDYYDYVVLDPDRLVVVTADVAGHGLASALMVSGIRSCVKLLTPEIADGPNVMPRLSDMVRSTTRQHMKVSLALALLDRRAGSITVTSAGHPPAFLWQAATGSVVQLGSPNVPLGTKLPVSYTSMVHPLAPGDVVVLYTDGAYEMLGPDGNPYGLDRLERLIAERGPWGSAASLREAVLQDLWTYKGSTPQEDDVTLLAVRVLDAGASAGAAG